MRVYLRVRTLSMIGWASGADTMDHVSACVTWQSFLRLEEVLS